MKLILSAACLFISFGVLSQRKVNPIIKSFGGIYDLPFAEEKVDPSLDYNIVVEVVTVNNGPDEINWALNNVARMLNLHAMAGVPREKLHVVLGIHGGAAFSVMDNEAYRKKYNTDNPNLELYKALEEAGVKMFVCGQSLLARDINQDRVVPQVKIASSMLTTMTTYQLKGYAQLVF